MFTTPINLWSIPKQLRDYMYKTQEQLSDIDVCRPFNGDHAKAMQSALKSQVGGSHYKDMSIQPIEFIERNKLSFSAGNVIKYICRADKKGGVEDLQKAKHYIELMIEMAGK